MWSGEKKIQILKPICFSEDSSEIRERWIIVYYCSYYVSLEQGRNATAGPHAARLFLQTVNEHVWLGTLQISCNFYDTKRIRKKLRRVIRERAFFCSKESGEEEFDVTPPSEEIYSHQEEIKTRKIKSSGKCIVVRAPKLRCPLCKACKRTSGHLRRHLRVKHKRTLVYMHKAHMIGAPGKALDKRAFL